MHRAPTYRYPFFETPKSPNSIQPNAQSFQMSPFVTDHCDFCYDMSTKSHVLRSHRSAAGHSRLRCAVTERLSYGAAEADRRLATCRTASFVRFLRRTSLAAAAPTKSLRAAGGTFLRLRPVLPLMAITQLLGVANTSNKVRTKDKCSTVMISSCYSMQFFIY